MLQRVVITPEVYLTVCTHALTTEAEEIMGLLLGDLRSDGPDRDLVAHIRRAVPQIRTDRRRDRVETSPEQITACSALAEHISSTTHVPTRIVGWYHSHPHITVLPSHVDCNTQAVYQMLDRGFVGLICSAFNASAASKAQTVQLTAFQAVPGGSGSAAGEAAAGGGGAVAGSGGAGASSPPLLLGASSAELDDQQLQAALAASAAEQHEAARDSWQRREVPLSISQDSSNPSTLADYVEVQRMLLAEEEAAHAQLARTPSGGGGGGSSQVHTALLQLLDSAAHQQALLQQADCVLAPALMAMQQLQRQQALQARQLQADNQRLKELLAEQPAPAADTTPAAAPGPAQGTLIDLMSVDEGDSSTSAAAAAAAAAPPASLDLLS